MKLLYSLGPAKPSTLRSRARYRVFEDVDDLSHFRSEKSSFRFGVNGAAWGRTLPVDAIGDHAVISAFLGLRPERAPGFRKVCTGTMLPTKQP